MRSAIPVPNPAPPETRRRTSPAPLDEHGRGLVLVDALADRWEVLDRQPPGTTVRAEVDVPYWSALFRPPAVR
ncbi:hypothetical protein QF035_007135 [Streptomyces umbrinus]|uniref:ATP-binding protein n=1 Tax=Streptomyces umbrinus TaxID=67370 RepID=A0ABU0T166_9ACTN|nr:hypothetical protein [Streptomyces umbrinus]